MLLQIDLLFIIGPVRWAAVTRRSFKAALSDGLRRGQPLHLRVLAPQRHGLLNGLLGCHSAQPDLLPQNEAPLPIGNLAAAHPVCAGCTLPGIFRPDAD